MSTRHAEAGGELRQERWASSGEYNGAISALLAAKRIALVEDAETKAVLWWIQQRSLRPGGLKALTKNLFAFLPKRVGTATMHKIKCKSEQVYGAKVVRQIRDEFPLHCDFPLSGDRIENWCSLNDVDAEDRVLTNAPTSYKGEAFFEAIRIAALCLPQHLTRLCLDPDVELTNETASRYSTDSRTAAVWYFTDFLSALKDYRTHCANAATRVLAATDVTEQMCDALDFCFRRRRMILIEGVAGIGKSATIKAWCDQYPGLVRRVEIPSSGDDRSFYAAIASAVGVARGGAYNGQQIKLKVEEALRESGLMLVLDEAQFAWPQHNRPRGVPSRMQWIKTAFDAGTPIALVALPEFSDWQKLYVERTLWRDSQLVRRLNRTVRLPAGHSKADLLKIARAIHPNGDEASWKLLAGCAIALPKKQASAITEAFISATDIAEQDGRVDVSYEDIEAAISLDFPAADAEQPAVVERPCRGSAVAMQQGCTPVAERSLTSSNGKKSVARRLAEPEGISTA